MKHPIIFKMWRHKLSALAAIAAMAVIFLWPSIPLRSVRDWLQFFVYYTPQNYLYSGMTIFSGLYVGAYVYDRKVAQCCTIESTKTGASGSLVGILLGACPACIPALAFLLPLSITIVLSRLSVYFLILSLGIMLFALWRIGGFQKV